MQREHIRRGFTIHQKVVLEIDFSGCLWGYTEITIVPTSKDLKTIHLHSRQCTIHSVRVASQTADFVYYDPLTNISLSNAEDCHNHPELKRKIYSALAEGDEGELSISIPKEVNLRQLGSVASRGIGEVGTPEPSTPGPALATAEFGAIVVRIDYSLRNPVDGFQFVLPTDSYPYRVPHAYTTPSSPDSARCWVPCVDNLWEKCTWEFEFVVPRYLEEQNPEEDDYESDAPEAIPTIVVCSGELTEQVAHPNNSNKTIFLFSQAVTTSVQHIAFAAGPFHVYQIPNDSALEEVPGSSQSLMHAFCLPGHEATMKYTTSFLRSAMNFYSTELGSYPFGSFKIVMVDELPTQRFDSATLSLVTTDILHGEDAIEQLLEARHSLSHALACQWVGVNIHQKVWSDTWLINGLGLYITGLFLKKLLGNNEYRYRIKKDMQRIIEWDNGSMPPICQPQNPDPPDASVLSFINLKAPLVLHMLDKKLGKSGTSLGLSRVLPKIFLSAISGELPNNALSTHSFLRMCRKVSGVDLRQFTEQWIHGSGCPAFGFSASFNRKKMAVEITMRQEVPAWTALQTNEISKALLKPVQLFEGTMTVRIHEADGTPYEHVLDIRSNFKRYEVPFNTKYKRVRRNTKRYLARQMAAQAAAEGDAEAAEAMGQVDMGFGLEIWEKEQERENWKVSDWTEEEEQAMSGATYEWIRMDADFEWIAGIAFEQPDFMWVSQLQRDRDVVAQLEAVHALIKQPTAIVSSTLTKTVLVSNYYYRIRCEAALGLVQCAIRKLDFLGLFHLFKLFLRFCYEPEDPNQDLFTHSYVPKPNNFSYLPDYFVRKSLINAISRVRFENGKTPSIVRQFLIDQLRYNDNTSNPFSDAFYICAVISALACASVSTVPPERGEFVTTDNRDEHTTEDIDLIKRAEVEIDRYRSMDRLIPSAHNIVTVAALEFYMILSLATLIPDRSKVFFPLTREGNYTQVRIAAFDGLFLTKWYTPDMMEYMLAVMAKDPSRIIRRHVARGACQSLALLVAMGELKSSVKETESLLIEEDGATAEKTKEAAKKSDVDLMIKILRKDRDVGKNEILRKYIMPIILAPDVDHEVRWSALKLADILVRGVEEVPPKVMIHLPPTPVTETAPALPAAKVQPKAHLTPSIKVGGTGTPARSPLVPFTPAPKVKLPLIAQQPTPSPRTPVMANPPSRNGTHPATGSMILPSLKRKGRPPRTDKVPTAPKAQAAGMSINDLKACRSALKKLNTSKAASLFLQPVDPVRDKAPNYFEIIKNPMDLGTMGAKLEAGMYKSRADFEADFNLMINNAKTYNLPGSYVHNQAITLLLFFQKQWARINNTLEAAAAQPAPTRMPPPATPAPHSRPPAVPLSTPKPAAVLDTPTVSRPSIKLKLGTSQSKSTPTPSEKTPSEKTLSEKMPRPRLKIPKPAPTNDPPPPEVDDGSLDLLQEVLAMEKQEKEAKKHTKPHKDRSGSLQRPQGDASAHAAKRRKVDFEDDDVPKASTSTAPAPSKASRPSVDPPAKAPPKGSKESTPIAPPPAASKPPMLKIKKDPPAAPEQTIPDTPTKPLKGKEKEPSKPTPSQTPAKPNRDKGTSVSDANAIPINERKCREVLRAISKLKEYSIFAQPVDPIRDGCPTYLSEIKEPMDFGTMSSKLSKGRYTTMGEFLRDAGLVFSNCRKFNPPGTYPVICADVVEGVFRKEWSKAAQKKLASGDKRALQGIISTIMKEDVSWIFRVAVDPVLLGIPTYFDVIPRKDARDLSLIKSKLDADKYDSVEAFEADVDLMLFNCEKFNHTDAEVLAIAHNFKKRFRELMTGFKSGLSKKRKEGEKGEAHPAAKKVKLL